MNNLSCSCPVHSRILLAIHLYRYDREFLGSIFEDTVKRSACLRKMLLINGFLSQSDLGFKARNRMWTVV